MYQIPDILYQEKMPPRAKKLFAETFSKYHKLNGGDEDVAIHKARQAVEKKYVKMDTLHNSWIPRKAAYEIVKDDIDDNEDDNNNEKTINQVSNKKNFNKFIHSDNNRDNEYTTTEYETDGEDDEQLHDPKQQSRNQYQTLSRKRSKKQKNIDYYDTSEDEDLNFYNY